jgi:nitrogen fixation protein FixH
MSNDATKNIALTLTRRRSSAGLPPSAGSEAAQHGDGGRPITGWMVLGFMVAFFAVIIGVNMFMAHAAISTFGGVETASSYHAGQLFERDVAMAKEQDAQHWQVDAKISRAADGTMLLDITARDKAGAPLSGLAASAQFARPTDRRLDRTVAVRSSGPGHFVGGADLASGQWDLIIELSRQDERLFRSKNRVFLK